jgi:superkiller protein 3
MAHYNLGLLRFEQGELEGAARSFERALSLDPNKAHYHFSLARAYRASYEFGKAAASFHAGLALSPPPDVARPARLELALTLKHDGRLNDSETELRNLVAADAADGEALFQLGRLYLAMNRYPEAEGVFRRLTTDVSPEYAPAHFMLGFVSYREDDPEKALASFRKLLELTPDHAEGRYYLGMSLQKLGDRPGAREAFEETLRIDPEHVGASYNLALLLAKEGEREESQKRLERFRELGERRERLAALEERVRWDPANAKFYLDLGQEYSRQKRTKEALQAFQRALELQPDLAAAEVAIANLLGNRDP